MDNNTNRLLLQFEQLLRECNREHINPLIKELSMDDLKPVATLVARSRAQYLAYLYELSDKYAERPDLPTGDEIDHLAQLRRCFIDLVEGSKSFETAIQRGYLDIKPR